MTGEELRKRVKRLGLTYAAAAGKLGLSLSGLNHQMRGEAAVSRQTALLLWSLEHGGMSAPPPPARKRMVRRA